MLDFWVLVFWILRLVDICRPGTAILCTVGDNTTIYICTIYIYTCVHWLDQAFTVAEGYLANRKNGALLSTSTHKNDDSKA